jgi:hypothetical protein
MATPIPPLPAPQTFNHDQIAFWYRLQRWIVQQILVLAGGGGGGEVCQQASTWATYVDAIVKALPSLTPTAVLTGTAAGDLQAAITALAPNGVLHVATNATYSPVQIPGGKPMTIMAAPGFSPKISGANAILLLNGAAKVVISGFELPNCTTADNNALGACIALDHLALTDQIIFANLDLHDVVGGSGVMLSYHQSISGDNYQTAPLYPSEFSTRMAFVDCTFFHAGLDGNEGANLALRGVEYAYIKGCTIDGDAQNSRGVQLQDCVSFLCMGCTAGNFVGPNCEAFKADYFASVGPPATYRTSGVFRSCAAHDCNQGFDSDDQTSCYVVKCEATNCSVDGFHVKGTSGARPGWATFECCTATGCNNGFFLRTGSSSWTRWNNAYGNTVNYNNEGGAPFDPSSITSP